MWLAKKLGVTRQTVGEWVRREEKIPVSRQAQIKLFLGMMPASPIVDADGYALREDA